MENKIRIVICDDEAVAISIISASVEALFSSHEIPIQIECFTSVARCMEYLKTQAVDLIFLDIVMPEMDGIAFGRQILSLKNRKKPDVIFVSSNQNRVFETFAIQPFGFVRKDHFMKDISDNLERYIEKRLTGKKESFWIQVQDGTTSSMLNTQTIRYIESYRNTQTIHLNAGDPIRLHSTMEKLLEQVQELHFIRIHKGYIVSCRNIKNLSRTEVSLFTGEKLPVGRAYHEQAAEAFMKYIRTRGVKGIG